MNCDLPSGPDHTRKEGMPGSGCPGWDPTGPSSAEWVGGLRRRNPPAAVQLLCWVLSVYELHHQFGEAGQKWLRGWGVA